MNSPAAYFRLCSSCKRPLAFGARYYTCSVSPCNRSKMLLTFCSLPCFQAHVPVVRHREAWAEEQKAPTQAAFEAQKQAERDEEQRTAARPTPTVHKESEMSNEEVLIVVSKVKTYIKGKSGMNTSDAVAAALSELVRKTCDQAIERAKADGRKTVMDRDVTGG
jgi:hypothetical protein